LWEINGTNGDIQVTGPLGHGQLIPLTIRGATGEERELRPLTPPAQLLEGLPQDPVVRNVLLLYKRFANDIRNNTHAAPTIQDGLKLMGLAEEIEKSVILK